MLQFHEYNKLTKVLIFTYAAKVSKIKFRFCECEHILVHTSITQRIFSNIQFVSNFLAVNHRVIVINSINSPRQRCLHHDTFSATAASSLRRETFVMT